MIRSSDVEVRKEHARIEKLIGMEDNRARRGRVSQENAILQEEPLGEKDGRYGQNAEDDRGMRIHAERC